MFTELTDEQLPRTKPSPVGSAVKIGILGTRAAVAPESGPAEPAPDHLQNFRLVGANQFGRLVKG